MGLNIILSVGVIAIVIIILVVILKKSKGYDEDEIHLDEYSIEYLEQGMKETFNKILKTNVAELNLNKNETEKRERNKSELRKALRNSSYGDIGAKEFVKDYIKDLLQKKFGINETTVNKVIPFQKEEALTVKDKFEILMHIYKKKYGKRALEIIIKEHHLDEIQENGYEIKDIQIEEIFRRVQHTLNFVDKMDVISQRIYEQYLGLGCIDDIRDMKIDGINGGVSGVPYDFYSYSETEDCAMLKDAPKAYDSIWLFFQGKKIRLSFLGFDSENELKRICKNIYKYNKPGILSETKGYIINEMKDGSRVSVARPPFSETWVFLVRKFDNIKNLSFEELLKDKGSDKAEKIMKYIVKGCQVGVITGEMGSGKTTLLKTLIQFFDPSLAIRVQELVAELCLRKIYPTRNIISFRETSSVSGQDGLDFMKKSDGNITILGEVATAEVANWLIQLAQVASKTTYCTHHAKTTDALIKWFRNAICRCGGYQNEQIAEEQVVSAINFDIHYKMEKGHRYIERITEILPVNQKPLSYQIEEYTREFFERTLQSNTYKLVNIMEFEQGEYVIKNRFSERAIKEISECLTDEEMIELEKLFEGV